VAKPADDETIERLRRSEERLRVALESAHLGVWYCDRPFNVVRFNTYVSQQYGLPPSGVIPRSTLYEYAHPDDREMVRHAFERSIALGEDYDLEHRTMTLDGHVRWVRVIGRCFLDDAGKPDHFDGIVFDITDRVDKEQRVLRAEAELRRKMESELHEATEMRERLLGIVGHDLKTPLTAIAMAAALLSRQTLEPPARRQVDTLLRSAERMKRLINELLDFARIRECGGIPIKFAPVDLAALCRHVIDECAFAYPCGAISFDASGDDGIIGDSGRLAEAFSNVLGNAIQHGGGGAIAVRVEDEGDDVSIAVHNEGPPIPPELLPVIFEPFRKGDAADASRRHSVGLGLYIARQIVDAHAGRIEAHSPDRDGTTFVIHLPRRPIERRLDDASVGGDDAHAVEPGGG
jgi:PAS domain S-box-containing protein